MKERKIKIRKEVIIILIMAVTIMGISLEKKILKNNIEEKENKKAFAIMISNEKNDGYVEFKENIRWPDSRYKYKEAKCVDIEGKAKNNIVTFDHTNWHAVVETDETVYCTLYFDKANPAIVVELTEKSYDYLVVKAKPKEVEGTILKYEFQIGKETNQMGEWQEGIINGDRTGSIKFNGLEAGTDYYVKTRITRKIGGEEKSDVQTTDPFIFTTKDKEAEIVSISLEGATWEYANVKTVAKRGTNAIGSYCYVVKEGKVTSEAGIEWSSVMCDLQNSETHTKNIPKLKADTTYTILVKVKDTKNILSLNTGIKEIKTQKIPTPTVTYNNNGGSGCNTTKVTYGNAYGNLCTPTRADHYFAGWFNDAGQEVKSTTKVTTASNHKLTAHWNAMPVRIYYYVNGGTINSNGFSSTNGRIILNGKEFYGTVNYGTSDDLANYNNSGYINVIRTGYNAKSGAQWNTKANGSGTSFSHSTSYSYSDYSKVAINRGTYYELNLYVNWEPSKYTVTYNNNGGSGCNTTQVTYGNAYGNLCTPTRADHYFAGWFNDAGQEVKSTTKVTTASNHKLTAHWNAMPVRIYYYVNGGTINSNGFSSTNGRVILNGKEFYGTVNYGGKADLANYNNSGYINIVRAGYMGKADAQWNTKANGSGTSFSHSKEYDYATYKKAATNRGTYYELNLYVNWIQKPIRICFHPNGGEVSTANGYGLNSYGYIALNGETFCKMVNSGGSLGANGLPDYNNSSALKISNKSNGKAGEPGAEWRKRTNNSIKLSQNTNYTYNDLKALVTADDEKASYYNLFLEVNWVTNPCSVWNQTCSGGYYGNWVITSSSNRGLPGTSNSCSAYNYQNGDVKQVCQAGVDPNSDHACYCWLYKGTWISKTCKNTTCKTYKYAW